MSAYYRLLGLFLQDSTYPSFKPEEQSGTIEFYRYTEMMIAMCVIAILCAIALEIFSSYRKQAILIDCARFDNLREQVHVYHSITGEWPSSDDVVEAVTGMPYHINGDNQRFIQASNLDRGAVSYVYKRKELEGKIVTMRPAVPDQDSLGPVIWVVGNEGAHGGWTIVGEDKTTVEPWVINRYLR